MAGVDIYETVPLPDPRVAEEAIKRIERAVAITTPDAYVTDVAERETLRRVYASYAEARAPAAPILEQAEVDIMSLLEQLLRGLDPLVPEELIGLDITPGVRTKGEKKGKTLYQNVWIEDGKVKVRKRRKTRVLGYTPQYAKKKYRTKRRRKRLTKRDMYIISAMKDNPNASALALML